MASYNVVTWPQTLIPDSWSWGLTRFDGQFTSPQSGDTQTIRRGYRITCDLDWKKLGVQEAQALAAFLELLADRSNKVRVQDYSYVPQGLAADTTNLLEYSQQLENAVCNMVYATATDNAVAAPDGTVTAASLIEDTLNNRHGFRTDQPVINLTADKYFTASVYAKPNGRSIFRLYLHGNGIYTGVSFDVSTGAVVATEAGTGVSNISYAIAADSNGFYRCSVSGQLASGYNNVIFIECDMQPAYNTMSYTGDGTSGLYIWGAQLQLGAEATDYRPTTTRSPIFVSNPALNQIIVGGLGPNLSPAFKIGDFIQLASGQLVRVADVSVDADANGEATINLTTWLRSVPTANSAVTLIAPSCLMESKTGAMDRSVQAPKQSSLSASLVEYVP